MARFIIIGPRGCGKHALASAIGPGNIDLVSELVDLPSGDWACLARTRDNVHPDAWLLADAVFTHVGGQEFGVEIVNTAGTARIANITLCKGRILSASGSPVDLAPRAVGTPGWFRRTRNAICGVIHAAMKAVEHGSSGEDSEDNSEDDPDNDELEFDIGGMCAIS